MLPASTEGGRARPLSPRLQVVIHSLEDAHEQIDTAIGAALRHSKPAYICISCNLAGAVRHTGSRSLLSRLCLASHSWMRCMSRPSHTLAGARCMASRASAALLQQPPTIPCAALPAHRRRPAPPRL